MWQPKDNFTETSPQIYIANPPVKAMQVPILRDPGQSNEILAYLKAGTAIQVTSKTNLWLSILLPDNRQGYIQAAYARIATGEEIAALQSANTSSTTTSSGHPQSHNVILTTQTGLTSGPKRSPKKLYGIGLLGLSFTLCTTGGLLARGIGEKNCSVIGIDVFTTASCSVSYPFENLGITLVSLGFCCLIVAIIVLIVSLVQAARRN